MKKNILFLLITLISLFVSFVAFIIIDTGRVIQVNKFSMDIRVINSSVMGMNVDPGAFHFGALSAGRSARRELWIRNVEEDAIVIISKRGLMAQWVGNPNDFIIRKGENKNISFSISVPKDAKLGNYTGEVFVVLKRI
jgi:hypothetical protein